MIRFLRNLFSRRRRPDPSAVVEEVWVPRFKSQKSSRFLPEHTRTVESTVGDGKLSLILKKKNLFGWAENPTYRYRDFILEATIAPDPSNGHCSTGFLLRRADELNYYYFLVSPAGHFRFDVVFNGNPRPIVAWSPCPEYRDRILLRIVARGQYFGFFLDEEWIGEIEDGTIDAGYIAFAAQNYDEEDTARFDLEHLKINSVAYEVEAGYYRWRWYIPADPERRLAFARSLAAQGRYQAACVQFNLASKETELEARDLLALSECYLHNGLTDEADSAVEKALARGGGSIESIAAKADVLYRRNRVLELRDLLQAHPEVLEGNSVMWNLFGNAWYALGNPQEAADAYGEACRIDPDVSVYRVNAARAFEKLEDSQQALDFFLIAARLLFREENYAELSAVLSHIEHLDRNNREALAIRGKLAFGEGRYDDAMADLEKASEESDDSSVHYLYGILLAHGTERERAAQYFERATELEPGYYLYWFRRAENEHILRRDAGESIRRALDLSPDDKWVLNLAGLVALEENRNTQALELLEKAYSQAEDDTTDPAENDILINYTEALRRNGETSKAVDLLKGRNDDPALLNQLGNVLSQTGDYEGAVAAYERAVRLAPDNRDYCLNCAAACIETDRVLRAEELLAQLLDGNEDATAYNLIGNAAGIKGELKRAEAAYVQALKVNPSLEEAAFNLADLQLRLNKYDEAGRTIDTFLSESRHPRLEAMKKAVKDETEVEITCAGCGRRWSTKKVADTQPRVRIRGELPDEAPAGMCPACGKVYCVGCAKLHLRDGRFHCSSCGESLKLLTDHLKIIVSRYAE